MLTIYEWGFIKIHRYTVYTRVFRLFTMHRECPIVETPNGKVKGRVRKSTDPDSKFVFNFLGVPYGKSPEGERRFAVPERCDPWEGVKYATKISPDPPQATALNDMYNDYYPYKDSLNYDADYQSEDCLALNLFTPTCNKSSKLPVMVLVVGGGFSNSRAMREDGTPLAGMYDVVVVCPNYRSNALGFLSLGKDSICPGNNGIQDIILALRWVQDNVDSFGGDPSNVTLFGESAGSVITQILMLSTEAQGLFHKAIMMSTSLLFPGMVAKDGKSMSIQMLKHLNIDPDDPVESILAKLRSIPIDELLQSQISDLQNQSLGSLKPCIDGKILDKDPVEILKGGVPNRVPLLLGVASHEMGGILSIKSPPGYLDGLTKEGLQQYLTAIFGHFLKINTEESGKLASKTIIEYTESIPEEDPFKYSKIYCDISTDLAATVPMLKTALAHSYCGLPTYFYKMDHQLEMNHSVTNGPQLKNKPDFVTSDHGDIIHFIIGVPFLEGNLGRGAWYTDGDRSQSRLVMSYFSNFAKNGDPNIGTEVLCKWPVYTPQTKEHIVLSPSPRTGSHLKEDKMELVETLLQNV